MNLGLLGYPGPRNSATWRHHRYKLPPSPGDGRRVAYIPSLRQVAVASGSSNRLVFVRPDNTVAGAITLSAPTALAYVETSGLLVVATGSGTVVVRPFDRAVVNSGAPGAGAAAVAFHPLAQAAYVAALGLTKVGASGTPITALVLQAFSTVVYCPSNGRLYMGSSIAGEVRVVDHLTETVVATIAGAGTPAGMAYCPETARLYVAQAGTGAVGVINPATSTYVASVAVGGNPLAILYSPVTGSLWVATGNGRTVVEIRPATLTVLRTIVLPFDVDSVGYSPEAHRIYAAASNGLELAVIRPTDGRVVDSIFLS